jgi:hypothetical protein
MSLKPKKTRRVLKGSPCILFDFEVSLREMLRVRNAFVRYRYQERFSSRLGLSTGVNRKVKANILIERKPKLSQRKVSVGQNRKAQKAENDGCG